MMLEIMLPLAIWLGISFIIIKWAFFECSYPYRDDCKFSLNKHNFTRVGKVIVVLVSLPGIILFGCLAALFIVFTKVMFKEEVK